MSATQQQAKRFSATEAELANAQLNFDFLLPYKKALYTTFETSKAIGRGDDYVRELIDLGRLEAHSDSAFGEMKSHRVTRRSIALYLARTAQYEPASFINGFKELFQTLTTTQLTQVVTMAAQERARRPL